MVPTRPRGSLRFDIVKVESTNAAESMWKRRAPMYPDIAGLMDQPEYVRPDENIAEIADIHQAGGLLYYDGANTNAIMGISVPVTWALM